MARREVRRRQRRRRRVITLGILLVAALVGMILVTQSNSIFSTLTMPTVSAKVSGATVSAQTRARIVSLALGQVGYSTNPSNTYCNKFSAYWIAGTSDCGNANRDEQWCADFAAWAWRLAGVPVVYQFINGDLNSSSASFYEWGVRHHTWHPLGSGYIPQPGDVAVYGLDAAALVAQHVAVVVSYTPGSSGPNAVNGDGSHTGFSRVEYKVNEYNADAAGTGTAVLAGYVSPNA
ncbi:MAG: CHAP domain-containing protein [Acidimicrobiaceae bacterium]|nr:CHAP domain-containing protein [Acidimicrobiaceae bacterium]